MARSVLQWKFSDGAASRMEDLADRNNKGLLSPAEQDELDRYLRVGSLVNLLQAKVQSRRTPSAVDRGGDLDPVMRV
ncbi:MAG: hypothetical protein WD069_03170 [Planctomycetales bacterium]